MGSNGNSHGVRNAGMNAAMQQIFIAQQAAALEQYNRARDDPQLQARMAAEAQQREQQREQVQREQARQPTLMGMLGSLMENMSERVVPMELNGGSQQDSGPPPASEKVLRTIPMIEVTKEDLTDDANKECCICLEENKIGSTVKRLPCGHLFHPCCIDSWISKHCTCPVCRYELETTDEQFNREREKRMRGRKPRYHTYELKRMGARDITNLAKSLSIPTAGALDKSEIVERIINSGKIDIIAVSSSSEEYTMSQLEGMKIKQLKAIIKGAGVKYREMDVVERRDLIELLVNSGRINIVEEVEIMGIDEDEGEGKGEEKEGEEDRKISSSTMEEWVDVGQDGEKEQEWKERKKSTKTVREHSDEGEKLGSSGFTVDELHGMSVGELKKIAKEKGVKVVGVVEKRELVERIVSSGLVLIADF